MYSSTNALSPMGAIRRRNCEANDGATCYLLLVRGTVSADYKTGEYPCYSHEQSPGKFPFLVDDCLVETKGESEADGNSEEDCSTKGRLKFHPPAGHLSKARMIIIVRSWSRRAESCRACSRDVKVFAYCSIGVKETWHQRTDSTENGAVAQQRYLGGIYFGFGVSSRIETLVYIAKCLGSRVKLSMKLERQNPKRE